MGNTAEMKKELRKEIRRKIKGLTTEQIEMTNRQIYEKLMQMPEIMECSVVYAYYSIGREVDTHAIIEELLRLGKTVGLPVSGEDGQMEFYETESIKLRRMGRYGIPEPQEESQRLQPGADDVIIVPGLTFDLQGNRLGQGGGYYDRYLEKYSKLYTIGLVRAALIVEAVPRQAHDISVRSVVSDKEIARLP